MVAMVLEGRTIGARPGLRAHTQVRPREEAFLSSMR